MKKFQSILTAVLVVGTAATALAQVGAAASNAAGVPGAPRAGSASVNSGIVPNSTAIAGSPAVITIPGVGTAMITPPTTTGLGRPLVLGFDAGGQSIFVDPTTGRSVSPGNLQIDLTTGQVVDTTTGLVIGLLSPVTSFAGSGTSPTSTTVSSSAGTVSTSIFPGNGFTGGPAAADSIFPGHGFNATTLR